MRFHRFRPAAVAFADRVDENVEPARLFDCGGDNRRGVAGYVAGRNPDLDAVAFEPLARLFKTLAVAAVDHRPGAGPGKRLRHLQAEAASTAGNQSCLAAEIEHGLPSLALTAEIFAALPPPRSAGVHPAP